MTSLLEKIFDPRPRPDWVCPSCGIDTRPLGGRKLRYHDERRNRRGEAYWNCIWSKWFLIRQIQRMWARIQMWREDW